MMWVYASSGYRLIDHRLAPEFVKHLTRQYAVSTIIYAMTIFIGWRSYRLGLGICIFLTMLYLLPSKKPVYRHDPIP